MTERNLYVVDDEMGFLELVADVFEEDYKVSTFKTGQSILEKISEIRPDILLLGVGLPDMTGYEICQQVKSEDPDDATSVVFISGHDSLDERIKGFNLGADDYLIKPIQMTECLAKIKAISRFQDEKRAIKDQEQFSRDMAFKAMTEASQYGSVIQFVKKAANSQTNTEIAQAIIDICSEFSLNCSVQIRSGEVLSFRAKGGDCSPIEYQLFELLANQGRVYAFKQRYMFNDKHLSILVTNMPIDDESKLGHMNDLMATIVEAGESAILGLARLRALNAILSTMQTALAEITEAFSQQKSETVITMDKMMTSMEDALSSLGLTDEQETFFIRLVESTQDSLLSQFVKSRAIETDLRKMVDNITRHISDH
jgi:DNA-binding response OmpR family regulator